MSLLRTKLLPAAGAAGLLAAVLLPPSASAADPGAGPAAPPCGTGGVFTTAPPTCTYDTAGTDTFTVPAGVDAVTVDLYGAEGGGAAGFVAPNPPNTGAPGGLGGRARATLAVTPGAVLQVTVGAAGVPGSSRHGEFARPGGFGHGAGGGGAHGGGGSGGGASDLRTGAFSPADRAVVAGGGGGAGNGGPLLGGGAGGGLEGAPGGQGGGPAGSGVAGGGGTQAAHGAGSPNAGGGPGIPGSDIDYNTGLPNPGSGGPGGNGSRGGNGGGGGGGGWFGGGGGSGGANPGNLYGAGGGGGSGHAAPQATDVTLTPGVRHGSGRAVITFRYGSAVTVEADTATPLFGHAVTLTAAVAPSHPAGGTPTGTVTFRDGTAELATVPLEDGTARLTTSRLRPGAHRITASYGGDPSFTPAAADRAADVTVGFSRPCLTDAHEGALTVESGEALCLGPGGSQHGPLTVRPGGSLALAGAELTGPLNSDGARAVEICGSDLTGPVRIADGTGPLLLGSATGAADCTGNTLTGPVTLTGNAAGSELGAARVTGPLRCTANADPFHQAANTVRGPRTGQCA
ncbi:Ig-like domain-containing protein [Streptomyces sp. NPDC093225]|uniref:Ig-like domain-containing protein n=1 Tax=Streptomyces sp. NPDC093225 TaxID=3366034 RepID=UPI003826426B